MKNRETHNAQIKVIAKQIATHFASDRAKRLRFDHGSTLQLKHRDTEDYFSVDISQLNDIIEINPIEQYAIVEPNVPLDRLISQTLEVGLIPAVVPELPGITCGGAVIGGAGESPSYKVGLFDDNCSEYEIVLGNGKVTKHTAHYEELIPITDYLFRYNRNGFWMGKVFFEFLHIPYTKLTRKLFSPYLNARAMFDAVQKLNLSRSFFIHDYVTDFDAAADLISYADSVVGIYPIWLCPIRTFHAKDTLKPTLSFGIPKLLLETMRGTYKNA
jgi:hypothetical protein